MFLGPAAVGKTSLRHGLMEQPLPDKPDSTIFAQTHPVKYSWVKIAGTDSVDLCMTEVSKEDEIDEEARLILDAGDNPDTSQNQSLCISEPHDQCLEAPSHDEVKKHKQQVFAKAAYKQSQHKKCQEMWLHLWDCGGQPVFLDVLPAFLSSRTLFLLMFNASKSLDSLVKIPIFNEGKQKDGAVLKISTLSLLQKWIASIHAQFGDTERQGKIPDYPRIILVGTHGDQLAPGQPIEEKKRQASVILRRLNASFEGKGYADIVLDKGLVVDNTTAGKGDLADTGFKEIHRAIFDFVQEKLSKETPVSWVHFRKVLQLHTKKKKPVINLAEVYSIAAGCYVPKDEVPSALLFYHELGVFLFYPNIEGLELVVILEPQWLVDRFGELFASWKGRNEYRDMWNTLTQFGILVEPLFQAVWSNVREHNLTPGDLVKMLEHFLLAAPIVTTQLHAKSGKVKEYLVPHMLEHHLSQQPLTTSLGGKIMKLFSSCICHTRSSSTSTGQNSEVEKAAPIHLSFLSGYVPPGYYVRLVTSLASKEVVMVLFHTGIYRNQISMDIGVDRLTITEHNETIELQFSRQESIEEPFQESCRRLLILLKECFSEVHQWLPGAETQLAFSCSKCSQSPQPGVLSRAKLCPFTLEQHLRCQVGHHTLPSKSQKYWLQDVDTVRYHCVGGGDDKLDNVQISSLATCSRPDVSQPPSDTSQLSTAALTPPTASQTSLQDTARMDRSRQSASSDAATQQLKPLNRPPEYLDLLDKVAARARDKWRKMGVQLNIPTDQLKSMTATDPIVCYANVFNWWQRNGSPPYTWATIIDALRASMVGEVQLARELEEWITTVQAPVAAIPTITMSTVTASSTPGVHGSTTDTLTASNILELNSTTDRSCSSQDTSTTSGTGVVSSATSGEGSLRGAAQPAAITPQPTTSSGSLSHGKERPTKRDLLVVRKKDGSRLKIMFEITSYGHTASEDLATLLLGDDSVVRKLHLECKDDNDAFVRKVFDTWLNQDDDDSTRSTAPCTWEELCQCVEDTHGLPGSLVKEIRNQFCS